MNLNELSGYYDSYERDLVKEFYIPMFESAKIVDRVSCYFSSKALALYASGLEQFANRPECKYRLIVSEDISREDFEAIREGEKRLEDYDPLFTSRLHGGSDRDRHSRDQDRIGG